MAWQVPARFIAALKSEAHHPVARVDIVENGAVVRSSDTTVLGAAPLTVADGGVSVARTAVRRQGSFQLAGPEWAPIASGDLLDPLSAREFRPYRGIKYHDGTVDWVPLGTLTIATADVTDGDSGATITVAGSDRAARVAANPWRTPYVIAKDAPGPAALEAMVRNRLGVLPVTCRIAPSSWLAPGRLVFGESTSGDPWADITKVAEGMAFECFFDPMGDFVAGPPTNPDTAAVVWEFVDGDDSIRVGDLTRSIDGRSTRNGVIVRGEAPWLLTPVSGEAWDTDPLSPTYYDPAETDPARIARMTPPRPERVSDAIVSSNAQAAAAAAAKLIGYLGIQEQITWTFLPHPGLDVGDVITLQSEVVGPQPLRYVIDTLPQVPFDVRSPMQGTTRRRRR